MNRVLNSIPVKIALSILLIESILLALMGGYYSNRFDREIDMRVADKLALPARMMSKGALSPESVKKLSVLSDLIGEPVVEAFLVGQDGAVSFSRNAAIVGKPYRPLLANQEREALAGKPADARRSDYFGSDGRRYISLFAPVTIGDNQRDQLYIRVDGEAIFQQKRNVTGLFVFGALAMILLTTLLEAIIVYRLVVPRIKETSKVLRRITTGDLSARIANPGTPDQLGVMMALVNSMIATIEQSTAKLRILNGAAEGFAQAATKEEIIQLATEVIEQQLPVRREYVAQSPGEVRADGNRGDTLFTLPVTDDERNYQVVAFVARGAGGRLSAMDRDFVTMLSRMMTAAVDRIEAFLEVSGAEARYRHLFTSALEGIFRVDTGGDIQEANPALAALTGYESVDELIGAVVDIGTQLYCDPSQWQNVLWNLQAVENIHDFEVRLRRKDGSSFAAALSAYTVRNKAGDLVAYDVRITDVSERKRREQAERDQLAAEAISVAKSKLVDDLEWKNKQLIEALNELKATQLQLMQSEKMAAVGMTAGGVAHELNNLLAGIVSYPELLLTSLPETSEIRSQVEAILASGSKAAALVADLQTLAQGTIREKRRIRLEELIEEYLDSKVYAQLAKEVPAVEITTRFATENEYILVSPPHIRKMVETLVGNAAEAAGAGGRVRISTGTKTSHAGVAASGEEMVDRLLVLTVADNGPRIPRENLKHIFEPFFARQVVGQRGTGLGLTVAWNVVNEHGGSITVDSDDEGTVFTVTFPIAQGDGEYARADGQPEGLELRGEGRVLVVDDEPLQLEIAKAMLTRFGYQVATCASGEEAIAYLVDEKVDLVLLDMLMSPGMNGLETYRRILELHPGQKAIIVSGYAESKDVKRVMQLGASAFVKKPYTMYQIVRSVKAELEVDPVAV